MRQLRRTYGVAGYADIFKEALQAAVPESEETVKSGEGTLAHVYQRPWKVVRGRDVVG